MNVLDALLVLFQRFSLNFLGRPCFMEYGDRPTEIKKTCENYGGFLPTYREMIGEKFLKRFIPILVNSVRYGSLFDQVLVNLQSNGSTKHFESGACTIDISTNFSSLEGWNPYSGSEFNFFNNETYKKHTKVATFPINTLVARYKFENDEKFNEPRNNILQEKKMLLGQIFARGEQ